MKKPDKVIFEQYLMNLSYEQLLPYLKKYENARQLKVIDQINAVKHSEKQMKIEGFVTDLSCPYCSKKDFVKNGTSNSLQRYLCKACGKTFTAISETFMDGTNWTWEVWVKLLQMTMTNTPLDAMTDVLEKDYHLEGIHRMTVLLARHKLIHALSLMPKPILSGIVQVDETFFRESQKGTRTDKGRKLINVIPNVIPVRLPRRGFQPSRLGILGPEYACVVCAVDNNNRAVSMVISMGKVEPKMFIEHFDAYLKDVTYLCTDGSPIYTEYCKQKNIPQYVRPSSYVSELRKRGYLTGLGANPSDKELEETLKDVYEKNKNIMSMLYSDGFLDYIDYAASIPFSDFCKIKYENGLNLSRVNAFHNYLKLKLEKETRALATKYLPMYVDAYTFMYNWRHAHKTTLSSMKDAETMLIELVKNKSAFTLNDQNELDFFVAPKPTGRYLALLDEKTKEMRRKTDNRFFKFDEEDRVTSFNMRKYIKETPVGKLRPFGKKYGIKGYTRMTHWQLYSTIMTLPNDIIKEIVEELIAQDKVYNIYAEDIKFLERKNIPDYELTYSKGSGYVDLDRLFIIEKDKMLFDDENNISTTDNDISDDEHIDEDDLPF